MKPSETIKNYNSEVRLYTNYAIKHIKTVCKSFGPRPVGSEGEAKAQDYLGKELETISDSVTREEFKCSDKAFMFWVPLGAVLLMLSTALYTFGIPVAPIVLSALTFFIILFEFVLYKPVLDIFFPKKTSHYIIGTRKPTGDVKKRIFLCGHTDTAFEWTYTYHGGHKMVAYIIIMAGVAIAFNLLGGIYAVINGSPVVWTSGDIYSKIIAVAMYVPVPALCMAIGFANYKRPVVGANDDMSGCMVCAAVMKLMDANDIRFENTELNVMLSSGEECGLRGVKAWTKTHGAEIKAEKDVETVFIAVDNVREEDFMAIYDKDMSGVVKNDVRVAGLMREAAANAGFDVPIKAIELGSTDAAAVSQAGIPAAAFTAMDPAPARYYHTRLDTEDNLSPKMIENGLKIALETAFLFDEKGIS